MTKYNQNIEVSFLSLKEKISLSCDDHSILDDLNAIQSNLSDVHQELALMNTAFRVLSRLMDGSHAQEIELGELEVVLKPHIQMLYDATEAFEIALR